MTLLYNFQLDVYFDKLTIGLYFPYTPSISILANFQDGLLIKYLIFQFFVFKNYRQNMCLLIKVINIQ